MAYEVKNRARYFIAVIFGAYVGLIGWTKMWGSYQVVRKNLFSSEEFVMPLWGVKSSGNLWLDILIGFAWAALFAAGGFLIERGGKGIDFNLYRFRSRLPYLRSTVPVLLVALPAFGIFFMFQSYERLDPFSPAERQNHSDLSTFWTFALLSLVLCGVAAKLVVKCPSCDEDVTDKEALHCKNCGKALRLDLLAKENSCEDCGNAIKKGDKFCVHCGTKNL